MEKFETNDNAQKIHASYTFISKAKRYRQTRFYLREDSTSINADILDVDVPQQVSFTKPAAKKKPIFEIKVQFIVDKTQLSQKDRIMKETVLTDTVSDADNVENYSSKFGVNPSEFIKTKVSTLLR